MKRCPKCRLNYDDESLNFCLEDGTRLVDGPAGDESSTAILHSPEQALGHRPAGSGVPTEILAANSIDPPKEIRLFSQRKFWLTAFFAGLFSVTAFFAFSYFSSPDRDGQSTAVGNAKSGVRFYWRMPEDEQSKFISESARKIQILIGDGPIDLDQSEIRAIKIEIDAFVERKDSLSQKPFEEGLRAIYGRASQYAPLIIRAYDAQKVPPALGLYQAMIESEYRDCPTHPHPTGPVGLFQFSRRTAAQYGLTPDDYCDVRKQAEAAARHMSDLISDFGSESASWSLALFSFNVGADEVRGHLRKMRAVGITERNIWAIRRFHAMSQPSIETNGADYVTRFFAAAIIGESTEAFGLSTPPLTTLGDNSP